MFLKILRKNPGLTGQAVSISLREKHMIRVAEFLTHYPRIRSAVAYTELIICQANEPGEETSWDVLMAADLSPTEVVSALHEALEGEEFFGAAKARKEMLDPSFLTYIAGRMGAM